MCCNIHPVLSIKNSHISKKSKNDIKMTWKIAKWTGPRSACFDLNSKITMFIFPGTSSQNEFFFKHCSQKGAWRHIEIHIRMHIHIQIHIPYMGPGPAARPRGRPPVPAARPGPMWGFLCLFVYMHIYIYISILYVFIWLYLGPEILEWVEVQYPKITSL